MGCGLNLIFPFANVGVGSLISFMTSDSVRSEVRMESNEIRSWRLHIASRVSCFMSRIIR
jgi:hypothetical protein